MSADAASTGRADAVVVGGGFFGCCLALLLRGDMDDVVLLEREQELLLRASRINQARVHAGYHYPRSLVTAYRSFVNFPRFALDFRKAVVSDFVKLYAVARQGSKVNAGRFFRMFKDMGATIERARPQYAAHFNPALVEEVFEVREYAFDAVILRDILRERLTRAGVRVLYGTDALRVAGEEGAVRVATAGPGGEAGALTAGHAFCCGYSRINRLLSDSGLDLLPLKHEITEMPLVRLPDELAGIGVTVMDGPFFSVFPYPSRGLHSLHHVRYTPHHSWVDAAPAPEGEALLAACRGQTHYPHMIRDICRYMPGLREARHEDSLYEIKTVLCKNEVDDGRPILYRMHHGVKGFGVVLGGKIDNVYDVLDMIAEARRDVAASRPSRPSPWRYIFPEGRGAPDAAAPSAKQE